MWPGGRKGLEVDVRTTLTSPFGNRIREILDRKDAMACGLFTVSLANKGDFSLQRSITVTSGIFI